MPQTEGEIAAELAKNRAKKAIRLARQKRYMQGMWLKASEATKDRWFGKILGSPATRDGGGRPA